VLISFLIKSSQLTSRVQHWLHIWKLGISYVHFVQGVITDREHRISELEEALRESIRITAQREVVMHEQQMKLEHTERVVSNITDN